MIVPHHLERRRPVTKNTICNAKLVVGNVVCITKIILYAKFVIIDEAQNTTPVQMKMVLTRLGEDSRMIITGDLSQIDLPGGQLSGLSDAVNRLDRIKGIGIIRLSGDDVVRHPVVARILKAYETRQT